MAKEFFKYLDNGTSLNVETTQYFASIIGANPSQGARSPKLWNACFEKFAVSAKMHPFDVSSENLPELMKALKRDQNFIASAVAVPHKETIGALVDQLEEEAEIIGAVNCIYRKGDQLIGANTDGAGALNSLSSKVPLSGKKVLVFGLGGAGLAVATYLSKAVGPQGTLLLANRSSEKARTLSEKLSGFCKVEVVETAIDAELMNRIDVFVNSSSLGFQGENESLTPIPQISEVLPKIENKDLFFFDIVYQPLETELLKAAKQNGFATLNGLEMNLQQAVIAFEKAAISNELTDQKFEEIEATMGSV